MILHLRYTAMLILGSLLLTCVSTESVSWKYTCHSGANIISDNSTAKCTATAATENDAKAASFCFGPSNTVVNNTFTEYGCGKCPKKAKKGACLTCAAWNSTGTAEGSDNSNCNTWQPIFTYSCYQNEASVVCNNGTGVLRKDIHCWGPKPTYTGNNENLTKSGCGTCEAAHAENSTPGWDIGDCATCDYNNCNSAATMLSFLGLFTSFFWLCSRN